MTTKQQSAERSAGRHQSAEAARPTEQHVPNSSESPLSSCPSEEIALVENAATNQTATSIEHAVMPQQNPQSSEQSKIAAQYSMNSVTLPPFSSRPCETYFRNHYVRRPVTCFQPADSDLQEIVSRLTKVTEKTLTKLFEAAESRAPIDQDEIEEMKPNISTCFANPAFSELCSEIFLSNTGIDQLKASVRSPMTTKDFLQALLCASIHMNIFRKTPECLEIKAAVGETGRAHFDTIRLMDPHLDSLVRLHARSHCLRNQIDFRTEAGPFADTFVATIRNFLRRNNLEPHGDGVHTFLKGITEIFVVALSLRGELCIDDNLRAITPELGARLVARTMQLKNGERKSSKRAIHATLFSGMIRRRQRREGDGFDEETLWPVTVILETAKGK